MPQELRSNYRSSITSCLETGTPGINTSQAHHCQSGAWQQITTTLTSSQNNTFPITLYGTNPIPLSRYFIWGFNVLGFWVMILVRFCQLNPIKSSTKVLVFMFSQYITDVSDKEFGGNIKAVIVSVRDFITSLKLAITGHKPIFLSPRQTHKNFMS